jgi:hypothetical protein
VKLIIGVLIAVQSSLFLLTPYSHPDPQVYFRSAERKLNYFEVWIARTGSEYLMTRSKILAQQMCQLTIQQGIDYKGINLPEKKFVFIDPTCIVSVKALQAKFPSFVFTKFLPRQPSNYGYHKGLVQEAKENFAGMLGEAMIISRKDFSEKYLGKFLSTELKNDQWTLSTVDSLSGEDVATVYTTYFRRD